LTNFFLSIHKATFPPTFGKLAFPHQIEQQLFHCLPKGRLKLAATVLHNIGFQNLSGQTPWLAIFFVLQDIITAENQTFLHIASLFFDLL
jgi:hypothetical protein